MNIYSGINTIKRIANRHELNSKLLGLDLCVYVIQEAILKSKRPKQLYSCVPDIMDYDTLLYIGARTDRMDFGKHFKKNTYSIDVLEIFDKNVQYLKSLDWIDNIIKGDVRNIDTLVDKKYDVIFWYHGPEHIKHFELENALGQLKNLANKIVVVGCPWGEFKQEELYNNPWEKHISTLEPSDFEKNNFKTSTIGKANFPGSNIIAWYRV
jgi:hypothetical protein